MVSEKQFSCLRGALDRFYIHLKLKVSASDNLDFYNIAQAGEEIITIFPCQTKLPNIRQAQPPHNIAQGGRVTLIYLIVQQGVLRPTH